MRKIALVVVVAMHLMISGCTSPVVSVEVLPPRSGVTCGAPTVQDAANSRGLLDLNATEGQHGAYTADLRLSVQAVDARVDGVEVKYELKGASLGKFDGAVVGGDVVLDGEDDESRRAVLENVRILSRDAAIALEEDDDVDATETEFATLQVTLTPVVKDDGVGADPSTFALDLCRGCLVTVPSLAQCPNGPTPTGACRPGQDVPMYRCAPASAGGGG